MSAQTQKVDGADDITRYEQEFAMKLSTAQAINLMVLLSQAIGSYELSLGSDEVSNAHPNSAIGYGKRLLDEFGRARLGHKSTTLVTYTMVRAGGAA